MHLGIKKKELLIQGWAARSNHLIIKFICSQKTVVQLVKYSFYIKNTLHTS